MSDVDRMSNGKSAYDFPRDDMETPIGKFQVVATSGDHVHVTNYGSGLRDDSYRQTRYQVLANGVDVNVSAHAFLHPDGAWRVGVRPDAERVDTYASRAGDSRDVSAAGKRAVVKAIESALPDWIADRADMLLMAQEGQIRRDLKRASDDHAKAAEAAKIARAKMRKLQRALDNLTVEA